MDRTSQWLLSAVLLAAAPRTTARASRSAPAKPNIVLFLTDDQDVQLGGWTPMRFANKALIERGVNLSNWFVNTPVCCPSRSELLSGRYHHNLRTTVVGNIGAHGCWSDVGVDCDCMHMNNSNAWAARTLPPLLKQAGYRLFHAGKWINPNGMRQTAMCPTTAQMKELSSPTPPTDTRCLNVSGNNVAGQVNRNNNGSVVFLGLFGSAGECAAACAASSTAADPCHSWTYLAPSYHAPWTRHCYGRYDLVWHPNSESNVTSGVSCTYPIPTPAPPRPVHLTIHPGFNISDGDRFMSMCSQAYFNEVWNDDGVSNRTGSAPSDYTTSIIGNVTLEWLKTTVEDSRPFLAYVAPKCPHAPYTPAPWYADTWLDEWPVDRKAPRTPHYNATGTGHHWMIATQPIITADQAATIDGEFVDRFRCLLSVDEIVRDVVDLLEAQGQLDSTYIFFTSDHGYNLGTWRLPMDKMQAYDNDLRVPFAAFGPGIAPNSLNPVVAGHTDILPTFLSLAGVTPPSWVDGQSLLPHLITDPSAALPASVQRLFLTQSAARNPLASADVPQDYLTEYWGLVDDASLLIHDGHILDCANNSWAGIRRIGGGQNLLYAEYTDVMTNWDFAKPPYLIELYNVTEDPFQLTNIYPAAPQPLKDELHSRLRELWGCQGASCR